MPTASRHARPRFHLLRPHTWRPPARQHEAQREQEPRVYYSRAWFGLGALAAPLGLAILRRCGPAVRVGAAVLGAVGLVYMTAVEPGRPRLERVSLALPDLPPGLDGLRVGQISDCHLGYPHAARNLGWAVEQMRRERPDLIVLTGDMVSRHQAIPMLPALLGNLHAPLGCYAVPGNHDYWEGLDDLRRTLAQLGIPMLINEHRRLEWGGADLWLVGVDDMWDGNPDIAAALAGVPAGGFTLLLSHSPDYVGAAARAGVSLQLSGHSHGGHLRLPLIGPFTRPRHGVQYVIGRYQIDTLTLYVSRGVGGAPLRLGCPPEATVLTLRHAASRE